MRPRGVALAGLVTYWLILGVAMPFASGVGLLAACAVVTLVLGAVPGFVTMLLLTLYSVLEISYSYTWAFEGILSRVAGPAFAWGLWGMATAGAALLLYLATWHLLVRPLRRRLPRQTKGLRAR